MREKNGSGVRAAPAGDRRGGRPERKDWDRGTHHQSSGNSGSRNFRRSRSRSPIKSKLMALAMTAAPGSKSKSGGGNDRDKPRRNNAPESHRDAESNKRKLRMDELDEKRTMKRAVRSPERKPVDLGPRKKNVSSSLDKVVKKAREERSNYWDKKIIEAEEKDPQRWGHSGFKELYQKDFKRPHGHGSPKGLRRSRSNSLPRRQHRSPPSPKFRHHQTHSRSRSITRRSRSRSRSPVRRMAIPRRDNRKSRSSSSSPGFTSKSKTVTGRSGGLQSKPKGDTARPKGKTSNGESLKPKGLSNHGQSLGLKGKTVQRSVTDKGGIKSRLGAMGRRAPQNRSSSSDSSMSRSRSRSFTPPAKRTGGVQSSTKGKYIRGKRPPSDSESSSSGSSADGDVLQLHARTKGRSASMSYSDSQSSSSGSRSPNRGRRVNRNSSSSSSESGSSSDSDSDVSIRTKPKPPQNALTKVLKPGVAKTAAKSSATQPRQPTQGLKKSSATVSKTQKPVAAGSDSDSSSSATRRPVASGTTKKASSTSVAAPKEKITDSGNKTAKSKTSTVVKPTGEKEKSPVAAKKVSKSASESGETESETESSSDSDSEPRMTLSERFAKLAQMSTDKREMAKPVLSVNEIDTKMKVVKDFRNPEVPKVYVTGQGAADKSFNKIPPKIPEYPEGGDKRFASEERRRHFERMYRDEPAERPLDWSDARVRYNYYKERGCFDERPISLEEYVKWEDWYHKYREWLEREGYFDRMGGAPPPSGGNPGNWPPSSGNGGGNWPPHQPQYDQGHGPGPMERMRPNYPQPGRRVDRLGGGGPPAPLSSRAHFGRPEGNAYLQGSIGRRIDRTPGGSLVVNIHRGGPGPSNFGPRGRRIGLGRQR